MSAATIISQAFGADANLYTTVLQLPSDESVTPSQLRKAYYRQALVYHPDKQSGKSNDQVNDARLKFQAISVAYSILSDEDRRQIYDESGEMDDDDELNQSNTDAWKDYFKGIFGKVTAADIDQFTESYKCSDEEEKDVLKYYNQFKGDLKKMLECVMCSDEIDKKRWVQDYIKPAIEKDDVEDYMAEIERTLGEYFEEDVDDDDDEEEEEADEDETDTEDDSDDNKTDGKGKKRKVAAKAKPSKKKQKGKTKTKSDAVVDADLIAAIRGRSVARRQEGFGSLLAGLEDRYATKKKGGRKKEPVEDIPDDEFEKIQKRLGKRRK